MDMQPDPSPPAGGVATGAEPLSETTSHTVSQPASQPAPQPAARTLVVVVPCLDEEATVAAVVAGVPRQVPGFARVEVVVVDDGSADRTAERARQAGAHVLRHSRNLGLGRTFRDGVRRALELGADVAVTIDGDGQFDPAHIPQLVAPLVAGEADMATASRFARRDLVPEMPWIKRWGNRRVAGIVALLTGNRFHDVSCGFRALSRDALLQLNLFGGFTYTQETFLDLAYKGLHIVEVPLAVRGVREFGESRIASSVWRYGVRSASIMLRAFVSYRPFTFFATVAAVFLAGAAALLGFLLVHYLRTGAFFPHIWAGFVGGSLGFVGILALLMGVLGDMLVRMRLNQEKILFHLKRQRFDRGPDPR